MKNKAPKDLTDDTLLFEMMDWFRISRNTGGLKGDQRKYFQEVCKECKRRGLLNEKELYKEKL